MNTVRRLATIGLVLLPVAVGVGCTDGDRAGAGMEAEPPPGAPVATGDPTTLLAVMVGLRADMIRLSDGLWTGDFRGVADAAESIAEHPQVTAEERLRVHTALGDDFPNFVAADRDVHDLAMAVREAALREDTAAVLTSLSDLQHGCIACHTAFRERISP